MALGKQAFMKNAENMKSDKKQPAEIVSAGCLRQALSLLLKIAMIASQRAIKNSFS